MSGDVSYQVGGPWDESEHGTPTRGKGPMKTFAEYDAFCKSKAFFPASESHGLVYLALGLCGEAGEISEKVKKAWRDAVIVTGTALSEEQRLLLLKEVGDALWYVSALADALGSNLEEVAAMNVEKLSGREVRGTLKGSGDNR